MTLNKSFKQNMITISLCMITKNEEQFLEQCLNSVKNLVDEIIIVDTGSTDKTKEIASKFTAQIFDFKWCDDFSAARNESLKHAAKDWILILDADEQLDPSGIEEIKNIINNQKETQTKNYEAYSLPQLHYTNKFFNHPDFVSLQHPQSKEHPQFKGFYVTNVIRLFKNSPNIYFEHCVHETIQYTLERENKEIKPLPSVPIHHYQELKGIEDVEKKQELYFRLSLNNIKQYPAYAKSYNDVGIYYSAYKNDQETAFKYCQKAVELEPDNLAFILNLSFRLRDLQRYDEAIELLKKALSTHNDERVYRNLGYNYYQKKQYQLAIEAYQQAIKLNSPIKETILNYIEIIKTEQNKITL